MQYTYEQLAKMIDHSLLQPMLTVKELEAGCQLALAYDVASVCILPYYLKRCAEILQGSTVQASTTIGFPHGGHTTAIKQAEAPLTEMNERRALNNAAKRFSRLNKTPSG